MASNGFNRASSVLEISNTATVSKLANENLSGLTTRLDNHESGLNANAHGIPNIAGLQTALDSKQNTLTGYTGTITVVTGVDFAAQTTTTKTVTYTNGVVTSVV